MNNFLKNKLFNFTHWCFDYKEYQSVLSILRSNKFFDVRTEVDKFERFIADQAVDNFPCLKNKGFTEKSDLKGIDLRQQSKNQLVVSTSGASSGVPFKFMVGSEAMASRFALVDYRFEQIGYKQGESRVKIWYPTLKHSRKQLLKEQIRRKLENEHFISYFGILDVCLQKYVDFINKHRPILIEGYSRAILKIAEYLNTKNQRPYCPEYIVLAAGATTERERELISEAFLGAAVYDRYGCSEFGEIAHELPATRGYEPNPFLQLYVGDDKGLVKLEEAQDGEYQLYITDPRNLMTPFWKYKMNDVVVIKDGRIIRVKSKLGVEGITIIGPLQKIAKVRFL